MSIRNGKFFGKGIRVDGRKNLSKDSPIEEMPASDLIAVSLAQHIGKPALPVVEAGEFVMQGQLLAKGDGYVSANVFSSVSGEVMGIERLKNPNGTIADFVVIKNDGKYQSVFLPPLPDRSQDSVALRIRDAGIVGMGGAGFPTHVKLKPAVKVDTLIINGAECEPYLTCDYRLMIEKTAEIADGISLIAKILGAERVLIAIENNKPDCIQQFSNDYGFEVVRLRKAYPMGSEKHLIYSCTGRKTPPGKLPSDVGCVVQNVATAFAVYEAVELNKPLFERVMTVSGKAIVRPGNYLVKIGTRFDAILEHCGGLKEEVGMLIAGGPMMGTSLISTDHYSRKTDSGILALDASECDFRAPTPCINCGACANVCPMKLMPMMIDFYTQAEDFESAEAYGNVKQCINCGCCGYVCPARRSLIQSILLCKKKLTEAEGKR